MKERPLLGVDKDIRIMQKDMRVHDMDLINYSNIYTR